MAHYCFVVRTIFNLYDQTEQVMKQYLLVISVYFFYWVEERIQRNEEREIEKEQNK